MARVIARQFTRRKLVKRYQLDQSKVDEVAETVARRIMEAAHASGEQGQDLIEFAAAEVFEMAGSHKEHRGGIPRNLAMGFAKRMPPLMPIIRDLSRNVGQDIRPMLPIKQQLKLGADLLATNATLDALDENMKLWAQGDFDGFHDPFKSPDAQLQKNEQGESKQLERAKQWTKSVINKNKKSKWEKYVQEAKQFYKLDDSQSATADSILREMIKRADNINSDDIRREHRYRMLLWSRMIDRHMRSANQSSLISNIVSGFSQSNDPIMALEKELKRRIDSIPTQVQRTEAEQRIEAALMEMGYGLDESEDE
jgi:hypothetical protein